MEQSTKNLTLGLMLAALVIAGVVWGVVGTGDTPEIDPTDPTTRTEGPGGNDPQTGGRDPDRQRNDPGNGKTNKRQALPAQKVTIRGRCVDAETELPLSGCAVELLATRSRSRMPGGGLTRFGGRRIEMGRGGNSKEPDESAVVVHTEPDGTFRIELDVPARYFVRLTTKMNRRAEMRGFLPVRKGGVDAGDIHIPAGAEVQARVVDTDGVGQPGVKFRFYQNVTGRRAPISKRNWINATSDVTGNFAVEARLAAGSWTISVLDNVKLIKPAGKFEIRGDEGLKQLSFVVEMPDPKAMITGRLVDQDGEPVNRTSVQAFGDTKWPIGFGTSDENGEFQVRCRTEPGEAVALAVPRADGFEPFRSARKYAWGSQDVVLTLDRAGDVVVRVVAKGTDDPVEHFRTAWFRVPESGTGSNRSSRGPMQHHPDGEATIEKIPQGTIRLVILPKDPAFAPNEPLEFVKGEGNARLKIELPRRATLSVQLVTSNGEPVAGSRLQLVRAADGKAVTLAEYAVDQGQFMQLRNAQAYVQLLHSGVTDKTGHADLSWVASAQSLAIRALGPGHVPRVEQKVVLETDGQQLKVVVSAGATVVGSLGPLSVVKELMGREPRKDGPKRGGRSANVMLTYRGTDGPTGAHRRKNAPIDASGAFRIEGLHPGTWDVTLRFWRFGGGSGSNMSYKQLEPVTLRSDEERQLEIDVSDLKPASLRGQVFVNGIPHKRARMQLARLTDSGGSVLQPRSVVVTTEEDGSFVAEAIQPGRYRVSVEVPGTDARRPPQLQAPEIVEIAPGADVEQAFHIRSGLLHIALTDSNGKPVPRQYVVVYKDGIGFRSGAQTDGDGNAKIGPIAVGSYDIGIYAPVAVKRNGRGGAMKVPRQNNLTKVGQVRVLPGPTPTRVAVRMPAKK